MEWMHQMHGVLLHPKRNQEKGLELLEKVLEKLGCLPKRNIMNKQEFFELFSKIDTLIIDVTEQRITRPSGVEQHSEEKLTIMRY